MEEGSCPSPVHSAGLPFQKHAFCRAVAAGCLTEPPEARVIRPPHSPGIKRRGVSESMQACSASVTFYEKKALCGSTKPYSGKAIPCNFMWPVKM